MCPTRARKLHLKHAASLALCLLLLAMMASQLVRCRSLEDSNQQHPQVSSSDRWIPLKNFKQVHRRSLVDSMKSSESRQNVESAPEAKQSATRTEPQQQQQQQQVHLRAPVVQSKQVSSAVPTQLEASASVMSETRAPNYYQLSESRRRSQSSAARLGNADQNEESGSGASSDAVGDYENRQAARSDSYQGRPYRQESYESRSGGQDSYDSRQARLGDRSQTTSDDAERQLDTGRSAGSYNGQAREALQGGESNEAVDEADAPGRGEESNDDQEPPVRSSGGRNSVDQEEADSQAEQSAQEAAEASEAEAADRAALDEQQQTQREIIRAQAESEAKAIKEQQEALMRQQRLHQQIVMRRAHDLTQNQSEQRHRNSVVDDGVNEEPPARGSRNHNKRHRNNKHHHQHQQDQRSAKSLRWSQSQPDIQFSDQLENGQAQVESSAANAGSQDEQADYSMRRPLVESLTPNESIESPEQQLLQLQLQQDQQQVSPTEQHSYGAHYGTLHGHQSNYYQFAESHKKGQFDSGYKRGGKKFHVSGHSSQKKHHAEGHVKWQGKKGKGSHYWSLKHAGKKHGHGHGHSHEHGHGHGH